MNDSDKTRAISANNPKVTFTFNDYYVKDDTMKLILSWKDIYKKSNIKDNHYDAKYIEKLLLKIRDLVDALMCDLS
jgi:hypothetical protein